VSTVGTFGLVADGRTYEVVCPHCGKTFEGELLGEDERHKGFKCPHCKLFVPFERADFEEAAG
jgi:DNA-directed RNA polymerase subunit RPC12/RpoP